MARDRGVDVSLAPLKGKAEDQDGGDKRGDRHAERRPTAERLEAEIGERACEADGAEHDIDAAAEEEAERDEAEAEEIKVAPGESEGGFGGCERAQKRRRADEMQPEAI